MKRPLYVKDRIIVALDVSDAESCMRLLDKLYPAIKMFKVGSELFTAAGREALNAIDRKGARSFLDLKFHDIPATVRKAAAAAAALGADMFNVHAMGGLEMMKAAAESAKEVSAKLRIEKPAVLGVTVLTSMGKKELEELGIARTVAEEVMFLAELAKKAGLDGVVASAGETALIKKNLGKDFIVVTPGVRPAWADKNDQKRVATPKEAFEGGSDYVVIGRPITGHKDPKAAAEMIIGELE